MSITKNVNLNELTNLSQVGNTDASLEIQPQSSTVLCAVTVTILTSPTVTLTVTVTANCFEP